MSADTTAAGRLELVADGFSFPTSLTFDPTGIAYVAEAGLPFGGAPAGGRVWRLAPRGNRRLLADGLAPPVNGLTFYDGGLYISEAGPPGRISRLELDGRRVVRRGRCVHRHGRHRDPCVAGRAAEPKVAEVSGVRVGART